METILDFVIINLDSASVKSWSFEIKTAKVTQGREADYRFRRLDYPEGHKNGGEGGIDLDTTILPGQSKREPRDFGVQLRPKSFHRDEAVAELKALFVPSSGQFRLFGVARSDSQVDSVEIEVAQKADLTRMADEVVRRIAR